MTDVNYIRMIQGVYFAMTVRQLQNLLIAKNFTILFSQNIDRKELHKKIIIQTISAKLKNTTL
jgi:hypothetical protein